MRGTLLAGLTSLLLCAPTFAQTLGTITGAVKDSTGALIPGATVTVVNKATNATRHNHSLQFRFEAFNALNQPVWGDPNTTLSSPLYGSITTMRKPMRELQVGLKYVF